MRVTERLGQFSRDEVLRAGDRREARSRVGGLGHVIRIISLLTHALTEFEEASTAFVEDVKQFDEEALRRRHEPPAEREAWEKERSDVGGHLSVVVHLRVETFYALARLLLDTVARATERYFGPVGDVPLATHRELDANLAAFAERKRLHGVPARLSAKAQHLTKAIVDDRDLHVRFGPGPDPWIASVWSSSGDAWITREHLLRECGTGIESVTLREWMELLEGYVTDVLDYLEANRNRSGLSRHSHPALTSLSSGLGTVLTRSSIDAERGLDRAFAVASAGYT